jgi:hypothetical protein
MRIWLSQQQLVGDNDDAVEPAVPYDSRLLEFQRAPILDGTVRAGLKWAKSVVCNSNQPDYKMEKGQYHGACIWCRVRTPHKRCEAHDVLIHQAAMKKAHHQDGTITLVTTSRTPTRKSPRLYIEDDDEVQEVPPPPKVIHSIDLTSEDRAAQCTANIKNLPVPVTSTATSQRCGRPRLHQVETRAAESGTERDDTECM